MKLLNKMIVMGVSFMIPLCLTAQQNPTVAPQAGSETNANVAPQSGSVQAPTDGVRNHIPSDAYVVPLDRNAIRSCYSPQPGYDYNQPYYGSGQYGGNGIWDGKFSFEGDWLYWEVRGVQNLGEESFSSSSCSEDKCFNPKSHYDSGFRLGFWYRDTCSCLNFGVIWTELHNKWHKNFRGNDSDWVFQDFLGNQTVNLSDFRGSNHTKADLDYIDFDISYNYDVACCFSMTPHIGIRALWLSHSLKNTVRGFAISNPNETTYRSSWKAGENGVGIEGGIWLAWETRWCVSLFGHFGGALLYHTSKQHTRSHAFTEISGPNFNSKGHCKYRTSSPMFNYSLGVQYERCICNRQIALQASWEQVHLDYRFLQWQGLTLGLAVGF